MKDYSHVINHLRAKWSDQLKKVVTEIQDNPLGSNFDWMADTRITRATVQRNMEAIWRASSDEFKQDILGPAFPVKRYKYHAAFDALWIFRCLLTSITDTGERYVIDAPPHLINNIVADIQRLSGEWLLDSQANLAIEWVLGPWNIEQGS